MNNLITVTAIVIIVRNTKQNRGVPDTLWDSMWFFEAHMTFKTAKNSLDTHVQFMSKKMRVNLNLHIVYTSGRGNSENNM